MTISSGTAVYRGFWAEIVFDNKGGGSVLSNDVREKRSTGMDDLELLRSELALIEGIAEHRGHESMTTLKYRDNLIRYILSTTGKCKGIVELGIFRGGISVLLAHICRRFRWPLYLVDISPDFISVTKELIGSLMPTDHVVFFEGTLRTFAKEVELRETPLIIVDGDHSVRGVLEDICGIYELNLRPFAAIFHDFSLRQDEADWGVARAICRSFGPKVPMIRIGQQFVEGFSYCTKESPSAEGVYWDDDGSEGVIIELTGELCIHNPVIE